MAYVTEDGWYEMQRADPVNDQVAAGANVDLNVMIAAARKTLLDARGQGGTDVEAMVAIASSMRHLLDKGTLHPNTIINTLTAALIRLTGEVAPIELPPT
jgi:hypothetical protein